MKKTIVMVVYLEEYFVTCFMCTVIYNISIYIKQYSFLDIILILFIFIRILYKFFDISF